MITLAGCGEGNVDQEDVTSAISSQDRAQDGKVDDADVTLGDDGNLDVEIAQEPRG